ncbi:DUF1302 family protein [Sulfurimonas sp. C5]|uniref:DUF1302 family protein n=1 Tax=Sulfurimonas sp. C5 TaxID=3036947 RepID=UPI002454C133|nr:DUF1302 family protein [Sulfurimonas sp. C5]MDH4944528.1 DUF1302 family protein [Sulfurimonas sp. C5]
MLRLSLAVVLLSSVVIADDLDAFMDGFDETPVVKATPKQNKEKSFSLQKYGIEGELKQEFAYSYQNEAPHDKLSSLRTSLFLEYNQDLGESFKFKVNANSFYDFSYLAKGRDKFTKEELDSLESEVELFDAYIQGTLLENLDIKLGRQVVVWGKSDTIRVVDVLNPLDNRRPGMVDIEDLRLSMTMAKFDYYYENWSITPIIILEQREDKLPPFGGDFNPSPVKVGGQKKPNKITYALNVSGEFTGFDLDFYFADVYPNFEFYPRNDVNIENKITMYGAAATVVSGSWLFKTELAYNKNYRYLQLANQKLDRFDALVGLEYNGIADTTISLDLADKYFVKDYGLKQHNYQGALRITSDFMHDTLHLNYLFNAFGDRFDKGGYQRVWIEYDVTDSIKTTFGVVDYLGGNAFFDSIEDNDMLFGDISYNF